jgi:cytochrome c oxidase cbb3-type subunit 4
MTFQDVSAFARSYWLIVLMVSFAGIVVYALWPSNKQKFNEAARIPLNEEPES